MASTTSSDLILTGAAASGLTGPLYSGVDLAVGSGDCLCITGRTGSGKSTLLRTLAGLHPPGPDGSVLLNGKPLTQALPGRVGLILQNPDTQLLCPDVGSELAFGLENLRIPPEDMTPRMQRAMRTVGLDVPLTRPVTALSVGQKYKLLLAAMLIMEPQVLLLDEPCAQLDPEGLAALNVILADFLQRRGMVVLCEHDPAPLEVITGMHAIGATGLHPGSAPEQPVIPSPRPCTQQPALTLAGASVTLEEKTVWTNIDLTVCTGEILLLAGANGSGKTTLLRTLTGFQALSSGTATVLGMAPSPAALRGRVGYLIQNPSRQLTADTVREQVAQPLTFQRIPPVERTARTEKVLHRLGLTPLADSPPFLLSHGEQHLVSLAAVLVTEPEILLLDDPFVGLDGEATSRVWAILHDIAASGTAVLCAVHRLPAAHGAHRRYSLC